MKLHTPDFPEKTVDKRYTKGFKEIIENYLVKENKKE